MNCESVQWKQRLCRRGLRLFLLILPPAFLQDVGAAPTKGSPSMNVSMKERMDMVGGQGHSDILSLCSPCFMG